MVRMDNILIIETDRLILRPLTIADAETAFYGWTGDAEVAEYVSWLPHHSIDDTINWLKEIEWEQDDKGNITPSDNYIWGFVLKETGELFGSGGLIWEEGCQLYQVGYNIKKSHWNNGYTTEAMRAILRYAAKSLGIKRVAGGHAKENLTSAKVIEKLGFIYDRDDVTPHVDGIRHFDSREYYLDLEIEKPSALAQNIDKLHTTPMGAERIKRNLNLQTNAVIAWCKGAVINADIIIGQGKNWYVYGGGVAITINAHSFTVITAHKINAKVRVMRESDYECLPEFLYQAIYIPEGAEPPPRSVISDPEIMVYIKDFGMQPGDLGVVAERNDQVVGAAWTRIIPAYGHIDCETPELAIAILPEFRSYGIGTKLMKKLFEVLRKNGYKQTSLSVQKDNPAVLFYQRLGYKLSGERIDHAGHEDCLMVKEL